MIKVTYAVGQISLTKEGLISARELAQPCLKRVEESIDEGHKEFGFLTRATKGTRACQNHIGLMMKHHEDSRTQYRRVHERR